MKFHAEFREPVKIEFHLDGGYTRICLLRSQIRWDIPTERIPLELRGIGTQLLLTWPRFTPEPDDSLDDIRRACHNMELQPLPQNSSP